VFPRLSFFFRQALLALVRSLGVTSVAVATIGVALAVLATFVVIVDNLRRVAEELGRDVEISAYVPKAITRVDGVTLAAEIESWDDVEKARFLESEVAMEEFREVLAEDAVLLEGLPPDLLPPSVEIRLVPRTWTRVEVEAIGRRIAELKPIEDVRFGQDDIERVNAMLGFARITTLILGIALCLGTILIVSNTIRLTVYARRDEIEIMSLVGATNAFVRAPFVLEGMIQGVLGGAFAAIVLVVLEEGLRVGLERGLSYAYGPVDLSFVPLHFIGYLLIAGVTLGLVGSVLAVGRFLKV
jgi:cell division transport system permease protein